MEKFQTRREFLKSTGKLVAGVAVASALNPVMDVLAEKNESVAAPAYPWTYSKLDPSAAQERGYRGYYEKGGCARGVADAIIGQLADNVGYPFNQIPIDMYAIGATGYGIGSLCGSLAGAVNAIGLVCGPEDAAKIRDELFAWYRKAELPIYQPKLESIQTVAKSVNCDESVTTYMKAAGIDTMKDERRKERCAGVTGDVAKKTVELLNAHFNL